MLTIYEPGGVKSVANCGGRLYSILVVDLPGIPVDAVYDVTEIQGPMLPPFPLRVQSHYRYRQVQCRFSPHCVLAESRLAPDQELFYRTAVFPYGQDERNLYRFSGTR